MACCSLYKLSGRRTIVVDDPPPVPRPPPGGGGGGSGRPIDPITPKPKPIKPPPSKATVCYIYLPLTPVEIARWNALIDAGTCQATVFVTR